MASKLEFYLVRHGESMGNVDRNIHHTHADHAIPLSEKGKEQAFESGKKLAEHLLQNQKSVYEKVRLWVGPYKRTRETADYLQKGISECMTNLGLDEKIQFDFSRREDITLVEQQFGLFDGVEDFDLPIKFPLEHAHYKKQEDFEGRFWARMPLGESRFDVALRVKQLFGTFHRDSENSGVNKLIIVSHGVTLRAFMMQWLHLSVEWFENERNPRNASIRLLSNNKDFGYL